MLMPDRYKFLGLGDEDSAGRRAFRDFAIRNGISFVMMDHAIELYARNAHALPGMSDEDYIGWIDRAAAEIGATGDQVRQFFEWGAMVAASGYESTFSAPQTAAQLQTVRDEIERNMAANCQAYQADAELQARYRDVLEQQQALSAPAPKAAAEGKRMAEDEALIADIERQMGDPSSAYWKGPRAASMQQEYRELISSTRSYAGVSEHKIRKIEIEELMGDQRSEYWRGPSAQSLQSEYAEIVESELGALPPPADAGA
jgi:hypothetical protein